jgi:hypothetical protein
MSIEGLVSKAGVALGLQLVVVQLQLLQPRHRREQRRGKRHDAVTCNIRALLERLWKV